MSARSWTHHSPVKVIFRPGGLADLPELIDSPRIVLVTTAGFHRRGLVERIERDFGQRLVAVIDDVKPNPDVRDIQRQADQLRPVQPDSVLAIGGGSTIDTAKAIARLLGQESQANLAAMLRGDGRAQSNPAIPLTAVPSTAGTGAEVTPFGTVWDHDGKEKHSLVGEDLYPVLAVLDPELTVELPEEVTIGSGLDAISHAFESTWNHNASPVSLGMAARSLQLSLPALPVLIENPGDGDARADMLQASTLAGIAISQSRTALAHSISYPITARHDLPHGFACSFTLPALLSFNAAADDGRLASLARSLGKSDADELAADMASLFDRLNVGKHVAKYVPDKDSVMALTGHMFTPGRADNNLRQASEDDVRALLDESIDALGL